MLRGGSCQAFEVCCARTPETQTASIVDSKQLVLLLIDAARAINPPGPVVSGVMRVRQGLQGRVAAEVPDRLRENHRLTLCRR